MVIFTIEDKYNLGRADVRDFIVFVDEPKEMGGLDKDPKPTEYFLISLASCIGISLKMYCKNKAWKTGTIKVQCNFANGETGEKIIEKKISYEHPLDEHQIKRLESISSQCPVSKMISVPQVFRRE